MRKLTAASALLVIAACKTPGSAESTQKSAVITSPSGNVVDVIYAASWHRTPGTDINNPAIQFGIETKGEEKGQQNNDPTVGTVNHVCWQRCQKSEIISEEVANEQGQKVTGIKASCEVMGHSPAKDLIMAGGKMSPTAQEIITSAFVDSVHTFSTSDQNVSSASQEVFGQFSNNSETKNFCQPQRADEAFGLTRLLYHTRVYMDNRTSSYLTFKADGDILTTSNTFSRTGWATWDITPNSNTFLTYNGGNTWGGMTYKIYKGSSLVKHNGNGIYFGSSGTYTITVTSSDLGGGSSSGSGSGASSGSSKVNSCVDALNQVYNRYPRNGAEFSGSRDSEVKNCWAAAAATDWTKLMKVYYCEHPGVPVRKCFTYGAKALKEAGYSQSAAYKAMYAACQSNGSFASMTTTMLGNFKEVMLNRWSSGSDNTCISKFGRNL